MSTSTATDSVLAEVRAHYRDRFEAFVRERPASEGPWLRDLRSAEMDRFQSLGFPTTRHEDWRYTNVSSIAKAPLELATEAGDAHALRTAVESSRFADLDALLFVFVNGRFSPELSDDHSGTCFASLAAVSIEDPSALESTLGSCAPSDDAFSALNSAFLEDGALVHAAAGSDEQRVLHLLFITSGAGVANPRVLINAEPNSRVCVLQDHVSVGEAAGFTNAVTEVVLGANASVELVELQREGDAAQLFTSTRARQARASRFSTHTITMGGRLIRNDLATELADEGAECSLRGLFLGAGQRHIDNYTLVDHASSHCSSDELYKGVLDDKSRGVFRGRVLVRKDAQKTDALQSNPNLLLADSAEIDTKPQLEIYADDVKCAHGSAIGRLDADALFYLRSRGIGERDARALLMQGFAFEITQALPRPALAEGVRALLFGDLETTTGVVS